MPVYQILVHNTTDYDKLSAEKQNSIDFDKYKSQDLIPMNEKPTLSGQIFSSGNNNENNVSMNQSLIDLKVITNGNKNLSTLQKNFFSREIGKVQNEFKSTNNINLAIQKANEINLQIQLIQAQKALSSGFLAKEATKNLKEAESTIKDLKAVIQDEKLEKSLDEISTEVFWESWKLGGVTWLTSLNDSIKEWKIVNKINKDLGDKINEIVQKAQSEYISKELVKLEQERKDLIELGDEILSGHERGGATSFSYGDPRLDPPVVLIEEKIYKLQHVFDEKQLTTAERVLVAANNYKTRLKNIKNMSEGEEKKKAMKKYWNDLTIQIESSETMLRK